MDLCINMEALKNKLIDEINNSQLTIGAATFVVKDVYNTLYLAFLEEKARENEKQNIDTVEGDINFPEPIKVYEEEMVNEQEDD